MASRLEVVRTALSEGNDPAEQNWRAYVRARDTMKHTDWVRSTERKDRFYIGDQWEPEDISKLGDRPHQTHNLILSTVNTLLGEHMRNRFMPVFRPPSNDPDLITGAELRQRMWLATSEATNYTVLEDEVVADGYIVDRGYFDVRVGFDDNLTGSVQISTVDPVTVLPDPDAKSYDPKDWNEVFVTDWVSVDFIERMYGKKKARMVEQYAGGLMSYGRDSIRFDSAPTYGSDANSVDPIESVDAGEEEVRRIRSVRRVSRQHRQLSMAKFFVDPKTADTRPVPQSWDEDRIASFAQRVGLAVISRPVQRIRWTVTADRVVLHDEWSPYRWLTIVPFFPYYRRGRPTGVVANLMSPQETHNKAVSQELHVINTTANSGWVVDEGALRNMTEDELRANGAKTGLVIVKRHDRDVEKIQPNQIPTGLDRIALNSLAAIKEVSGVTNAVRGNAGAEASGAAIDSQILRAMVQNEVVTANLNRTRKMVVERVRDIWEEFYTEPRAVLYTRPGRGRTAEVESIDVNQEQPDGSVVNDLSIGGYQVSLDVAPSRETYNETQLADMLALRNQGVQIPDDRVVENTNLADRMEIAAEIRQLMGRGEPSEQEQLLSQLRFQAEAAQLQAAVKIAAGEVSKLEAEILKLQAEAMAQGQDPNSPELSQKTAALEADLQMRREELATRIKLAEIQARNRIDVAMVSAEGTRAKEIESRASMVLRERFQGLNAERDRQHEARIESIRARRTPNATSS